MTSTPLTDHSRQEPDASLQVSGRHEELGLRTTRMCIASGGDLQGQL